MRNLSAGAVLAVQYFPPGVSLPGRRNYRPKDGKTYGSKPS